MEQTCNHDAGSLCLLPETARKLKIGKLILFPEEKKGIGFHKILQSIVLHLFENGLKMHIILSAKKNVLYRNMKEHNDSAVHKFFY